VRYFLGWDRPFIQLVVEWLWARRDGMDGMLLVVPTMESGRKVRQALAERGACIAPQVITAGKFGALGYRGEENALLEQEVWAGALKTYDWDAASGILSEPSGENWEVLMAEEMRTLRVQTGEYGMNFYHVWQRLPETHPDKGRWGVLAQWEYRYTYRLKEMGGVDSYEVRNKHFAQAELPKGITHVVWVGVTDPTEHAVRMAEVMIEREQEISFLIAAPESDGFDPYGRPQTEYWQERKVDWPLGNKALYSASDPRALGYLLQDHLAEWASAGREEISIGVGDKAMVGQIQAVLGESGVRVFNPAGKSLSGWSFVEWLKVWIRYCQEEKVSDLRVLARSAWTLRLLDEPLSLVSVSDALQKVCSDAKPHTVKDLWRLRESGWPFDPKREKMLEGALGYVLRLVSGLREARALMYGRVDLENLRLLLVQVLGGQLSDEAAYAEECYRELERLGQGLPEQVAKYVDFAQEYLRRLEKGSIGESREQVHVEALGWLELAFESAPYMMISGLNEGVLPNTELGNTWLPESLREMLGMKTNADRVAHDIFYIQSLLEPRRDEGEVRGYFLKYGAGGEPMKPSRLILQVEREELAQRVAHTFSEQTYSRLSQPWRRDWVLRVPAMDKELKRLSASRIKGYLDCPFRYYLKFELGMSRPEQQLHEWSQAEFGSLVHEVLEAMQHDAGILTTKNEHVLKEWLWAQLDELIEKRFAEHIPTAFAIQRETLRQRLQFFAYLEVKSRLHDDQWKPVRFEEEFSFEIDGVRIIGAIDRVDQNAAGEYRLVDYKTGKVDPAEKSHMAKIPKDGLPAHLVDTAVAFEYMGDELYWKNLQLPIYALAYRQKYGKLPVLAYCTVAKTAQDTRYTEWVFTAELAEAAEKAIRDVIKAIRAERYWPPVERAERAYDDYRAFHYGYAMSDGFTEPVRETIETTLTQGELNL